MVVIALPLKFEGTQVESGKSPHTQFGWANSTTPLDQQSSKKDPKELLRLSTYMSGWRAQFDWLGKTSDDLRAMIDKIK